MKALGILAWPAHINKDLNPYNHILYTAIENQDGQVHEFNFTIKDILKFGLDINNSFQIFHMHWPSNILTSANKFKATRNLITFYFVIKLLKSRNKKIVWTVHNLEDHEKNYPSLQKKLYKSLYKYVDGFISLNKAGIPKIREYCEGKEQKIEFTPHPHYLNYYPNQISKKEAREQLGIEKEKFVFLFLGQIRAYKNVTGLVKAFSELDNPDKYLVLAGKVYPEVETELNDLIEGRSDIKLFPSFVDDKDLQVFLNSADLVVTPYTKIFNSGSVFLNLSYGKPTLAPAMNALEEISDTVGRDWIKTYQGCLSSIHLQNAMEELRSKEDEQERKPDISNFDPRTIATKTIAFYKRLARLA